MEAADLFGDGDGEPWLTWLAELEIVEVADFLPPAARGTPLAKLAAQLLVAEPAKRISAPAVVAEIS